MKMKKADVAGAIYIMAGLIFYDCHYHVYCADSLLAAGYSVSN